MARPWTNDGKKDGGLSSMDVLMFWLQEPGNYEQWEAQKSKKPFMEEIVKEMKANGIHHRAPRDVYFQIRALKCRYKPVKQWLKNEGQLELFRSGKATEKVEATVLKRFPHFRELAPLFDRSEGTGEDADVEVVEEDDVENDDEELSDADDGESETKLVAVAHGKRKFSPNRQESADSHSSKRGKQNASESQTLVAKVTKRIKLQEVRFVRNSYPFSRSVWEHSGADGDELRDSSSVVLTGKMGEELAQCLINNEVKRNEAQADRLQEAKKREEMQTKVEMVLLRRRLERAGYSKEEAEEILQRDWSIVS